MLAIRSRQARIVRLPVERLEVDPPGAYIQAPADGPACLVGDQATFSPEAMRAAA